MNYRQNRDLYKRLNNEQIIKTNLNFGKSAEKLKADYLDMYKGIYMEVISTDRFDEDTDLSTTYLGQVDIERDTDLNAEESFPMTVRCCMYKGTPQYTMLVFGLPSLHMLRWYRETNMQLNMYLILYYSYIFLLLQYHILYINTHLSV